MQDVERNAWAVSCPSVTVVVPTYREVENIPQLVQRLHQVREGSKLDLELLIVDDDSGDGTEALVQSIAKPWVRLIVRKQDRGLSQAVLEGLRSSRRDVLVVMDADLSHPPEKIPEMLAALIGGADFVVGSRYAPGGSIESGWGVGRWINSNAAALLARPLTKVRDPMSGFFALRRETFERGADLNPIGYKIGLELLVKCRCSKVVELPIHFSDRRLGKSKLSLGEQLKYLQHLRRLYLYRQPDLSHLVQFLVVGATGLVVNLALLTALLRIGVPGTLAVALAIALSMVWNFVLNRRFTFSYARGESWAKQLLGFVIASSLGAVVNYAVTIALWGVFEYKQVSAIVGVATATAFNFVTSRFVVFRKRVRARTETSSERT